MRRVTGIGGSPMRSLSILILVAVVGCAPRGDSRPAEMATGTATIFVGQPWGQAQAVARRAGYALHDASHLDMGPTQGGFYIDMPNRRGLIVFRDSRLDVVDSMKWVENWHGPKAYVIYHDVPSIEVPTANPAAR